MTEHGDNAGRLHGAGHDPADLAEEIRLLVEMVVEKAAPWLEGVLAAGHGAAGESGHSDTDSVRDNNCGWCPLCAIVGVVRGERPEVLAKVLEQAAQLVALLRAVLADRWEPQQGVHMPGFRPQERAGAEPNYAKTQERDADCQHASDSARVQHIPVKRSSMWEPGARKDEV